MGEPTTPAGSDDRGKTAPGSPTSAAPKRVPSSSIQREGDLPVPEVKAPQKRPRMTDPDSDAPIPGREDWIQTKSEHPGAKPSPVPKGWSEENMRGGYRSLG